MDSHNETNTNTDTKANGSTGTSSTSTPIPIDTRKIAESFFHPYIHDNNTDQSKNESLTFPQEENDGSILYLVRQGDIRAVRTNLSLFFKKLGNKHSIPTTDMENILSLINSPPLTSTSPEKNEYILPVLPSSLFPRPFRIAWRNYVNSSDSANRTIFHWAVSLNNTAMISYLALQIPMVNVNSSDSAGFTPFITACAANQLPTVTFLHSLRKKAPPPITDASTNAITQSQSLEQQTIPAVSINQATSANRSGFFYACSKGSLDLVIWFLNLNKAVMQYHKNKNQEKPKFPVELHTFDKLGHSPFYRAATKGHSSIVFRLLKNIPEVSNVTLTQIISKIYSENENIFHVLVEEHHYGLITDIIAHCKKNNVPLKVLQGMWTHLNSSGKPPFSYFPPPLPDQHESPITARKKIESLLQK